MIAGSYGSATVHSNSVLHKYPLTTLAFVLHQTRVQRWQRAQSLRAGQAFEALFPVPGQTKQNQSESRNLVTFQKLRICTLMLCVCFRRRLGIQFIHTHTLFTQRLESLSTVSSYISSSCSYIEQITRYETREFSMTTIEGIFFFYANQEYELLKIFIKSGKNLHGQKKGGATSAFAASSASSMERYNDLAARSKRSVKM